VSTWLLEQPEEDREAVITEIADRKGTSGFIVEKDFWVCWLLRLIFQMEGVADHLTFKGGTSLSKVYGLIDRFSEDIDISISPDAFNYDPSKLPEKSRGPNNNKKRCRNLRRKTNEFISNTFFPVLLQDVADELSTRQVPVWSLKDEGGEQTYKIRFEYPRLTASTDAYMPPSVLIELGSRSEHWPVEKRAIDSLVGEELPQAANPFEVQVIQPGRTFLEKATILHSEYFRPEVKSMPPRYSRHWHDVYQLLLKDVGQEALMDIDLMTRVIDHKKVFWHQDWNNFNRIIRGELHLLPSPYRDESLRQDYERMSQMLGEAAPTYDEMMELVGIWEAKFNQAVTAT